MVGVRMRPISSTSRKPSVVSTPVLAPTFCRMVFDAVVVPCTISAMSPGAMPAWSINARKPLTIALPRSSGVVDVLFTKSRPSGIASTISVKVPPISHPTRTPLLRCGAEPIVMLRSSGVGR